MRFSEKSFEVRFCAALTAALTPYDRNPKWFGLTQAQERKAGIDTMVKIGGRLFIFQFKASKTAASPNPSYHVEADQSNTLSRFTANHPNSVFYVFPSTSTIKQANTTKCLMKDSYLLPASKIAQFFKGNKFKSRTLHLDKSIDMIYTNSIKHSESASTTCKLFGCVCKLTSPICYQLNKESKLVFLSGPLLNDKTIVKSEAIQDGSSNGIILSKSKDSESAIKSAEEFEKILFEDNVRTSLSSGVIGLFIPVKL